MFKICDYNYTIKQNEKKELFNYLLTIFPKTCMYAFSKNELALKKEAITKKIISKAKFLHYNTKAISELIFDLDNVKHIALDNIATTFYLKFGLYVNWICYTDNGIQFCVSLNYPVKTERQLKVLRDFKRLVIKEWDLIDAFGSTRLKGWWRNPFKHTFKFYDTRVTFDEIKELLHSRLSIKQQFRTYTRKEQIKSPHFIVGEGFIGNRNNFVWYNTMLNTNSTNLDTILKVAKKFNTKTEQELDEKELLKISKSVEKYNQENKNFIWSNSKKSKWSIGIMGFEKINGLDYEEYKKEVKRRQSMAGKKNSEIGKKNLLKRNKELANKTKEKVYTAIRALKNLKQKVTIMRVVEIAEVSINSARKYIKQAKEEGLI